jgi:hypothetical protein
MMIRIASAAAIAALMSTVAMAQTMNPPPAPNAPSMSQPAPSQSAEPGQMAQPMVPKNSVRIMSTLPGGDRTVTFFYKQAVYDQSDYKVGDVDDLLVAKDGKISAAIVGVGGFLGIGEKNVAVSFEALQLIQKNNKWLLVINATKDELKNAPGFKYDRNTTTWMSDKSASNTAPTIDRTAEK